MEAASKALGEAGVLDRAELAGVDFFAEIPAGGDAYIIKSVLHDWDDDDCVAILRNVRAVCGPDTVLLVVEPVMPEAAEKLADQTMMIISDLNMMVCTGGLERTEAEFAQLLERSGFALEETLRCPAPNNLSVLRARPVG